MTKKTFREIVDENFPKLDILNYYPYGEKTEYQRTINYKVDLKKVYLDKNNYKRNTFFETF
jgi:hypothetical protein